MDETLIKTLAEEYDKKTYTDKQYKLVLTLYDQLNDDNKKLFEDKINNIDNIRKIIYDMKKHVPINSTILSIIHDRFNEKDLKIILSRNDVNNMTQHEAELILKGPKKFRLYTCERPIKSEEEWEYGFQVSNLFKDNKMYYLKFYNMMMLDYDNITYEDLISHISQYKNLRFRIYRTYKGFHVFIISHQLKYNSSNSQLLAQKLVSDIYYNLFSFKTGFKIRLSKKMNREEEYISKFMDEIGSNKIDPLCSYLITIHDMYIEKFNKKI